MKVCGPWATTSFLSFQLQLSSMKALFQAVVAKKTVGIVLPSGFYQGTQYLTSRASHQYCAFPPTLSWKGWISGESDQKVGGSPSSTQPLPTKRLHPRLGRLRLLGPQWPSLQLIHRAEGPCWEGPAAKTPPSTQSSGSQILPFV